MVRILRAMKYTRTAYTMFICYTTLVLLLLPHIHFQQGSCIAVYAGVIADADGDDWYSVHGRRLVLHLNDMNVKNVTPAIARTGPGPGSSSHGSIPNEQEMRPGARRMSGDQPGGANQVGGIHNDPSFGSKHGLHFTPGIPDKVGGANGRLNLAAANPVKNIHFCVNCPSPEDEGSIAYALSSYHMMATLGNVALNYEILSEAVYVVPNYVDSSKILNLAQLKGKIALVKRGKVPLGQKVHRLLERGSPRAVLIIDDGSCDVNFVSCGYRAGGVQQGGFSPYDDTDVWERALVQKIPVLMVSSATGARFDHMMALREVSVLGMGMSNMTLLPLPNLPGSQMRPGAGGGIQDGYDDEYDGYDDGYEEL